MKVVIVGAGFAGLQLARSLNNKKGYEITLVDKVNHHQFQPLYYQVATAGLDASNISFPIRKLFQKSKNVRFRLAEVRSIESAQKKIRLDDGEIEYDILVLAMGATTHYFGNEQIAKFSLPMKTTSEALRIRHHLITQLEKASIEPDPALRKSHLQIVVAGAGPTGVEVSGALAEMKKQILPRDYPEINFEEMRIVLVEGSDRTLGAMSPESSQQSRKYLENLGVEVMTSTFVKDYDGEVVTLSNGIGISTQTLIWAAGIRANSLEGINPEVIVQQNRLKVNRYNQLDNFNEIFALGDLALMVTEKYPKGHPQVANVAINQAKNLSQNLIKHGIEQIAKWKPYEYVDLGSMATVGRHLAVVDMSTPKIHFGGFFAWLVWMFLHLMLILGVKNKLQVFINWAYKYFTYDQSLRLLFTDYHAKEHSK